MKQLNVVFYSEMSSNVPNHAMSTKRNGTLVSLGKLSRF